MTDRGLTASEAAGMLDCWKTPFLRTPGRRVLLFMPKREYDYTCPLYVRPEPAQRVRVGIVLTELK
jgi:hypothetical protein